MRKDQDSFNEQEINRLKNIVTKISAQLTDHDSIKKASPHTICVSVVSLSFFFSTSDLKTGSLNVNGARSDVKNASLFKQTETKYLDVFFVQDSHSDGENECDRKEWLVEVTLSHKSGWVAVLLSKSSAPFSFEVEEISYGHILKVKMQY